MHPPGGQCGGIQVHHHPELPEQLVSLLRKVETVSDKLDLHGGPCKPYKDFDTAVASGQVPCNYNTELFDGFAVVDLSLVGAWQH